MRVLSRRNDLDNLTAEEFKEKTRLPPHTYRHLFNELNHLIEPKSTTNNAISSHTRLQATLRFLAQGNMFSTNCDAYGMSKASMSRHVSTCVEAICTKVQCSTS